MCVKPGSRSPNRWRPRAGLPARSLFLVNSLPGPRCDVTAIACFYSTQLSRRSLSLPRLRLPFWSKSTMPALFGRPCLRKKGNHNFRVLQAQAFGLLANDFVIFFLCARCRCGHYQLVKKKKKRHPSSERVPTERVEELDKSV